MRPSDAFLDRSLAVLGWILSISIMGSTLIFLSSGDWFRAAQALFVGAVMCPATNLPLWIKVLAAILGAFSL